MAKVEWSCRMCKHLFPVKIGDKSAKCKAFKKGVPFAIISGEVDHRTPYEGDHGITFEAIDK